jgi:hypothetical protein
MTDEEIIGKFRSMASGYMKDDHMNQIIEAVFELENMDDVGKLTELMRF